jgi:hypothetical protein
MDPSVTNALAAGFAALIQRESTQSAERVGRQSDGAAADMRGIGAAVFRLLAEASDPSYDADLNTLSHAPTPQPYVVPNYVYNPASQKPAGS